MASDVSKRTLQMFSLLNELRTPEAIAIAIVVELFGCCVFVGCVCVESQLCIFSELKEHKQNHNKNIIEIC